MVQLYFQDFMEIAVSVGKCGSARKFQVICADLDTAT